MLQTNCYFHFHLTIDYEVLEEVSTRMEIMGEGVCLW
jgi:hypothetical protein